MFSPNFLRTGNAFGFEARDAFRDEIANNKSTNATISLNNNNETEMNPPLIKRGKYTNLTANLDSNQRIEEQQSAAGSSSSNVNSAAMMKPKEGWKNCDYVSNRTRLRCQNQRRAGHQLKEYGFCEEHIGYIERIRKEGLRSKHLFDPSFEISQNYMQLISCDDDETLEPRYPADFPFVYESMYCDGRFDNDENPLRPARIYTQEEIVQEYSKSLKRLNSSLREQRTIYKEKRIRLLQQIARINGQRLLLDPVKEAEKMAHLLLMRKEAMKKNREMAATDKFTRMDEATVENCSQRRMKWQKRMSELDDNEENKEKKEEEGIGVLMVLDGINKIIKEENKTKEKEIEENICRNHNNNNILIVENDNKPTEKAKEVMDSTMVCARINRPFDGRRNANSILTAPLPPTILSPNLHPHQLTQKASSSSYGTGIQQMNNKNNTNNSKINHHHQNNININNKNNNQITTNNNIVRNVVDHDYELPSNSTSTSSNNWPTPPKRGRPPSTPTPLQQIAKTQMPIIGCIGGSGGTTNSYQQYLKQRHHIQVKQTPSIGLGLSHRHLHHPISLSRNQIYGNGHHPQPTPRPSQIATTNNKSATIINNAKRT